MNRRQQNEAQMLLHVEEFATKRLPDFTHEPPTKVDLKFASARTRIVDAITALGGKQAIQAGGDLAEETEKQRVARENLIEELQDVNAAMQAIAEETENSSLMERFRMPHSYGDSTLAAKARAFAAAIRELSLNDELEGHGHGPDTATDLDDLAGKLEGAEGEQAVALGGQVGATAAIPQALRKGKAAVKTLHAIIRRVYKNNAEVLAAWEVARHVQRSPRRETETPPAPQPPTP